MESKIKENNRLNNDIQLVNSIFNFYPKKRKISLKYQLQKLKSPKIESPTLKKKLISKK